MSSLAGSSKLLSAARPQESAKALATRHGPPEIRPALRQDLVIRRQVQLGDVVWVVKDPVERAYFHFRDAWWNVIRLFDGTRTPSEIAEHYNRTSGGPKVSLSVVLEWEETLRKLDLIQLTPAEQGLMLLDKFRDFRENAAEEKAEGFNPFFIKFHVLDTDKFLTKTVKYVRWIWTPPVVILTCLASIWTVSVFIRHFEPIWAGTMDLYHFFGKPLLDVLHFFIILAIIGGIHEFCHAYACKIYGGEVHDIGLVLFYFTPCFYCNTSDAYMFQVRWQRLWVTVAGIYIEAIICSAATLVWVLSYPDSFLNQFAYKTMLLTGVSTIFFNINPLVKIDGYYALSSLLQLPDLRETAFRLLSSGFQRYVLRLPVDIPVLSARKRRICLIYGVLSAWYTATIMFIIAKLISNFYTKFFPEFAEALIIVSLFYLFRKRLRKAGRVGKLFYLDKKELLMSPRSRWYILGAAAILLLILGVPWGRRTITAQAVLKPITDIVVQVPEEGVVTQVLVREGDTVERGQVLFRLTSPDLESDAGRSRAQEERFAKKSSGDRASADAVLAFQSDSRAAAAKSALKTAEYRKDFLQVRSPIAGRVLTSRLQDLEGRLVPAGQALVRIGDCRRMIAQAEVSERFLEYLKVDSPVKALVKAQSARSWRGSVAAISPATAGQPATAGVKDPQAPSIQPDRFIATAVFENPDGRLLPGAEASLKISSARASYLSRAGSVLWRWLRSIIW